MTNIFQHVCTINITKISRERSTPQIKCQLLIFHLVPVISLTCIFTVTQQMDCIGKNCALCVVYHLRPKTSGTVFPNTDQPWLVNNIYISLTFFFLQTKPMLQFTNTFSLTRLHLRAWYNGS